MTLVSLIISKPPVKFLIKFKRLEQYPTSNHDPRLAPNRRVRVENTIHGTQTNDQIGRPELNQVTIYWRRVELITHCPTPAVNLTLSES